MTATCDCAISQRGALEKMDPAAYLGKKSTLRCCFQGKRQLYVSPMAQEFQGAIRGDSRCDAGTALGSSISMAIWVQTVRQSMTAFSL